MTASGGCNAMRIPITKPRTCLRHVLGGSPKTWVGHDRADSILAGLAWPRKGWSCCFGDHQSYW
jgi:hypothetical protein